MKVQRVSQVILDQMEILDLEAIQDKRETMDFLGFLE